MQAQIQEATLAHNKPPENITLIAVSKGHSSEKICELHNLGQRDFGENYFQEFQEKWEKLSGLDIVWHFIGKLQSNKIKKLAKQANYIHGLNNQKHARLLETALVAYNKTIKAFININIENEPQKDGCSPGEALDLALFISKECPHIKLQGIMAIPPSKYHDEAFKEPPNAYLHLKTISKTIGEKQLSLGMSRDLSIAIAAGSTFLRIGTSLFGPRPPKT